MNDPCFTRSPETFCLDETGSRSLQLKWSDGSYLFLKLTDDQFTGVQNQFRLPEEQIQEGHSLENDEELPNSAVSAILILDEKLDQHQYEEVEKIFKGLNPSLYETNVILSILNATFHERAFLKERDSFVLRAESVMTERLGPERAEKLLRNRR